jgi:branched-chain amino acid transport system ATP-binding protein
MSVAQANGHTGVPMLDLSKVTKNFGGLAAVQDVDLQIWPREIISIIGPNGAGKTTVFNLITGIYRPSSGDIRI